MTQRKQRERRNRREATRQPFKQLINQHLPIEVLDNNAIELIHQSALQVMTETGLEIWDSEARSILRLAGAKVDEKAERVWFDPEMVNKLIARAPAQFTLHARGPQKHVYNRFSS